MLLNLHTHRPTLLPGLREIESVYFGQTKMTTAPLRSVGLHPWFLNESELEEATAWLRGQATSAHSIAIGEAGLDKVSDTPWPLQLLAFQRCVEISEATEKPLILHCVRAFSEIIALKKEWKPAQPWVFHGFDKNPQTANMLLRAGCFLSFGPALFRPNGHAAKSLLATPADRFFLETDDADMPIAAIYERAAAVRGITLEDLEGLMEENWARFFTTKARRNTKAEFG